MQPDVLDAPISPVVTNAGNAAGADETYEASLTCSTPAQGLSCFCKCNSKGIFGEGRVAASSPPLPHPQCNKPCSRNYTQWTKLSILHILISWGHLVNVLLNWGTLSTSDGEIRPALGFKESNFWGNFSPENIMTWHEVLEQVIWDERGVRHNRCATRRPLCKVYTRLQRDKLSRQINLGTKPLYHTLVVSWIPCSRLYESTPTLKRGNLWGN